MDSLGHQYHTKKLSPMIALHYKVLCESKASLPILLDENAALDAFCAAKSLQHYEYERKLLLVLPCQSQSIWIGVQFSSRLPKQKGFFKFSILCFLPVACETTISLRFKISPSKKDLHVLSILGSIALLWQNAKVLALSKLLTPVSYTHLTLPTILLV